MKELIGKKINEIKINDDQSILSFDTDAGAVSYEVYGDCCSESWFADITGVSALLGGVVQSADEISMDEYDVLDGRSRQEYDSAYGVKIATDKGYADIVFRNSSNGYYGGDMQLYTYPLPSDMTKIADDWQA